MGSNRKENQDSANDWHPGNKQKFRGEGLSTPLSLLSVPGSTRVPVNKYLLLRRHGLLLGVKMKKKMWLGYLEGAHSLSKGCVFLCMRKVKRVIQRQGGWTVSTG